MNRWAVLTLVLAAVVLQMTVLAAWRPWAVVPQLIIAVLIYITVNRSLALAVTTAGWAALWQFILSPVGFAASFLLYPFIVLVIAAVARFGIAIDRLAAFSAAILLTGLVSNLTLLGVLSLQADVTVFTWVLVRLVLLETVLTVVLAWLARPLARRVVVNESA